jgi:hypothetical protein
MTWWMWLFLAAGVLAIYGLFVAYAHMMDPNRTAPLAATHPAITGGDPRKAAALVAAANAGEPRAQEWLHAMIARNVCPLHVGESASDCVHGCEWLTDDADPLADGLVGDRGDTWSDGTPVNPWPPAVGLDPGPRVGRQVSGDEVREVHDGALDALDRLGPYEADRILGIWPRVKPEHDDVPPTETWPMAKPGGAGQAQYPRRVRREP